MTIPYETRINQAKKAIEASEYLLIGGGAGLSDAAGLKYAGKRFTDHFAPFIEKYDLKDMYSSAFYPFETAEESWAYWAKHISLNRYETPKLPLYEKLLKLAENKNYYVITTNVESQFYKSGFKEEKIFAVQGDYGYFQCASACHDKLYNNEEQVNKMHAETTNCRIPTALIPKCPVCGGNMDVNLRKDGNFVQDKNWYQSAKEYEDFLKKSMDKRIVLLELGVGYNTPGIIRYPFEDLTHKNPNATLIRMNKDYPKGNPVNAECTIAFAEDMSSTIDFLI